MANQLQRLISSVNTTPVFDVDQHTGFMAPEPPTSRLPERWEAWEVALDSAIGAKLQLGDKIGLTASEAMTSERWRAEVREVHFLRLLLARIISEAER
jgi:indoleamine 2,3-dioxygenase